MPNFQNYHKYRFMISEPTKYFSTLCTIIVGMTLFYIFSTRAENWYLIVLVAIFNLLTYIFMGILAFADPGIVPKIFSNYEFK